MKFSKLICLISIVGSMISCSSNSTEDWIEDIDYLASELPQKHIDFYKLIDSNEFHLRLDTLKSKLSNLDKAGKVLELQRILASLKVAHTNIPLQYSKALYALPLRLEIFDDGLFIYGIDELKEKYLEREIISINNMPLDKVYKRLEPFISYENEYWLKNQLPQFIIIPQILEYAGIINTRNEVKFQLKSGEEVIFRAQQPRAKLVYSNGVRQIIWLKKQKRNYWFELINDDLLYIQYNKCINDNKYPFINFVSDISLLLDSVEIKKVIIDLRTNSGGNSEIIKPLIGELQQHQEIKYFGAISRRTYSSGRFAARDILRDLDAVLIGEPTGGSPNSYGYNKTLLLPKSKIPLNYSNSYFTLLETDKPYIEPQIPIDFISADVFKGIDRVLEYVLNE